MQPREAGSEEGGNGWDGHQPDFLRRGAQPNGMGGGRPRRGGRGRCKPAETRPPAGGDQPQAAPADDDRDDLGGTG
jgi:hypothetical protein